MWTQEDSETLAMHDDPGDDICKRAAAEIEQLRRAAIPFCAVDSVIEKTRLINKSSNDLTPITTTFTVGQWKALRSIVHPKE